MLIAYCCALVALLAAVAWFIMQPGSATYVSISSPDQVALPGLWLGENYSGSSPLVALKPSGAVNGIYYAAGEPLRTLASVSSGSAPQKNWVKIKTPAGIAYTSPQPDIAFIKDPEGNWLQVRSYSGSILNLLNKLKPTP
jgi:hypothetical protein